QHERLQEMERRLEEYRAGEDELRRTVIAAERIGQELKQGAQREADLLLASASEQAGHLQKDHAARQAELEA
ncbi:MAG: cell division protein DivIVA, partial [Chloroflexota bacterium]